MIIGIIIGVVVIFLLAAIFAYGYRAATKLPDNHPAAFLKSGKQNGKVVVCIGDSITHGRVSHNYVDELASRHDDAFTFINAGINSELAYNALQRVDQIISCDPDLVTILIGTNDALATLNEKESARYVKEMKLPQIPDQPWFEENLAALVDMLQQKTKARIALLSLPPITEDLNHAGYRRAAEYSAFIKKLAEQRNLSYLPLNESLDQKIRQIDKGGKSDWVAGDVKTMYAAIFTRYLFRKSWDDIADRYGFVFLTDYMHLSGRGALAVADLIDEFLASIAAVIPNQQ